MTKVITLRDSESGQEGMTEFDQEKLPSLMQLWLDYTKGFPTTQRFNLWSCIAAVGGAMQRRCWMVSSGRELFPNTFFLLVSPPGVGKSVAIRTVREVWKQFANLPVAPLSMTGKGIVDHLDSEQSIQSIQIDGEQYRYSSLLIPVAELGTMIQEYDMTQISILNELYDCNVVYDERTRGGGRVVEIERPHISMIMGTQPKFLGHVFPEAAFGMGLTSRIIMIYDDAEGILDLFGGEAEADEKKFNELTDRFRPIAAMKGQFHISDEAKEFLQDQHSEGIPPRPEALKLAHYNTRRTAHMLKLSMILGAARHGEPFIDVEDAENSIMLLHDAESRMEEVFTEMSGSAETDVIREAFQHLVKIYHQNEKKPIKEETLHAFLQQRIAAWKIPYIVTSMTKSGAIKIHGGPNAPPSMRTITPGQL